MFTWLPIYKEIATWILPYRNKQSELCQILLKVGFTNNFYETDGGGGSDLTIMDPFTFFAFFQKLRKTESRAMKLKALKELIGLNSEVPTDFNGLPSANAQGNVRYAPNADRRAGHEMTTLWDLAEQAVAGNLNESTFEKALSIHGIRIAKLTQGLFWLNPEKFYPIDVHIVYLDKFNINHDVSNLEDYQQVISSINHIIQKPLSEVSFEAWKNSKDSEIEEDEDTNESNPENLNEKFRQRLSQYDSDKLKFYFEFVKIIIAHFKLSHDDKRIVFSDRSKRLNFVVGTRYCFSIINRKGSSFGFITKTKAFPESSNFDGPTEAFWNETNEISTIQKHETKIQEAIATELNRSRKSPHINADNSEFRDMIFGVSDNRTMPESNYRIDRSLNTIFYGPPGTGKTYNTILRAAEIVENRKIPTYVEALNIFNSQLHDQIEFITFHQNYSYEDFIQGIRPDIENNSSLTFERKDGIFKIIADRALKNLKESHTSIEAKESFEDLWNNFIQPLIDGEVSEIEVKMKRLSFFITDVSNKSIDFRKSSGGTAHTLSINTLKKMYEAENVMTIQGLATYYSPLVNRLVTIGKNNKPASEIKEKKYVIIIDEINRANISRVFGELITLIEPDKRSHGAIPLKVKLPSGEPFIVPSNLYIIGTMNTADKSIALLDIALRRRFEFEPMFPKYEIEGEDIYDADVLEKLNNEIISTKGHDFQIGHSYFMEENLDLIKRMNNKVIPLLLEYFMNDKKEVSNLLQKAGLEVDTISWPLRITGRRD